MLADLPMEEKRGSPSKAVYSLTGADVSIDTHVTRALEHAGLTRVIPREQFGELRREMQGEARG